jgi:YVTN family beta-propeller protein
LVRTYLHIVAGLLVATSLADAQPATPQTVKLPAGVYEVVVSESGNLVYAASIGPRGENKATVTVLDGETLKVEGAIDVSAQAAFGLGINDKTQTLHTSNTRDGNVSAIDLRTGRTIAVIGDDSNPKAHTFKVLVDEANNMTYVSIAEKNGQIWIIDGATNKLTSIVKDTGVNTMGMAIDPVSGRLYAANVGGNDIVEIDLKKRVVTRRFSAGGERPSQVAIDAKTRRLFVTNQGSHDISVLDTRTGNLIRTVKTGQQALGIGFNPSTNRVYVANRQAGTVTVVNAETYAVEANLAAGSMPKTVAVTTRTSAVFVTSKVKAAAAVRRPSLMTTAMCSR